MDSILSNLYAKRAELALTLDRAHREYCLICEAVQVAERKEYGVVVNEPGKTVPMTKSMLEAS